MKKQNEVINILFHAFGFEEDPVRLENLITEHQHVPCGNLIEQLKSKLAFIKKENKIIEILIKALVFETNISNLDKLINKYIDINVFSIQKLVSALISKKNALTPDDHDDEPPKPSSGFTYKP